MYKIKRLNRFVILVMVLASCVLVDAETPCAFEVRVQDSTGRPVANAVVALSLENSGSEISALSTDASGTVKFCDVRHDLYQLTIGQPLCGQVAVHYIYPILPSKRIVKAVYDNCHSNVVAGGCRIIVRFREHDKPIHLLDIVTMAGGKTFSHQTDEYGRLFQYLQYGGQMSLSTRDKRFRTEQMGFQCKPGLSELIERDVDLKRW